jgi:hypothetical protein
MLIGIKTVGSKRNSSQENQTEPIMLEIKRPVSAPLSPEQVSAIQETVARYKAVKGGLLPALHAVQGHCSSSPKAWMFLILTFTAS